MGATIPEPSHSPANAENLSHQERQTLALEKIAEGMDTLHSALQVLTDALRKLTNRVNGS